MLNSLYVSNLSHMVQRRELEELFAAHGTVRSLEVTLKLDAPNSEGTALVEMGSVEQATAAIAALNGMEHRGFEMGVGCAAPGQVTAPNPSGMFESMNLPKEDECHSIPVHFQDGFGIIRP
jgi:RNA recognition motif-containing protein